MFVRSNWKSLLFVLNELCNVFNIGNGALVAWPSVELTTKLSLFLVETLPFYYWTENGRFKKGSLDSFQVIPGSEQADEGTEEDGPATNPLRLHRVMRTHKESVAHFVSGRAFLPERNERTVRQQHHRPSSGVPPPSVFFFFLFLFLFSIEEENEWL